MESTWVTLAKTLVRHLAWSVHLLCMDLDINSAIKPSVCHACRVFQSPADFSSKRPEQPMVADSAYHSHILCRAQGCSEEQGEEEIYACMLSVPKNTNTHFEQNPYLSILI